jgi:hypothetical protein
MATAQAAAVREYTLGPIADYDYSTSSSGIPARIVAEDLTALYVLDKLTLPIDGTAPNLVGITALGTADVTGTRPGVSLNAAGAGASLTLGTCSTLTSSQGGVIVYTPNAATIPNVEVAEGKALTIQQAAAAAGLDIHGKLKGRGTLVVSTDPTALTIGGGDGNVTFSAAAITAASGIALRNTGVVTFAGTLGLGGDSLIAGDVVFNGNVTATAELNLRGNVTLVNAGVISFDNVMTLGAGKTISAKITPTPAGSATTIAPVLAAGSDDVELTPTGAVTLTAEGAPTKNTEEAVNLAKKISFGGNPLEITTGTLRVAPGAIFEVNDKTLSTKIDPDEIGYLAVAATGALSFTAGTGNSEINIGDTEISSAAASKLLAEGGTVILGNDKIQGDAVGAKLIASTGGINPVFTVDPTPAGGKVLILQQVDLNLAGHGSLKIKGLTGTVNQVTLADLAKITLNNGTEGRTTDRNKIGAAGAYATLTGDFEAVTAGSATTSQAAWSVAHKGGSNVSLIGIGTASTDVTLAKSGTSFVQ